METLKVSSKSAPNSVAGAIAGIIREDGDVRIQAVGAAATNQAIKSVAVARNYLTDSDIDIACVPSFTTVDIEGVERTAMNLEIIKR